MNTTDSIIDSVRGSVSNPRTKTTIQNAVFMSKSSSQPYRATGLVQLIIIGVVYYKTDDYRKKEIASQRNRQLLVYFGMAEDRAEL